MSAVTATAGTFEQEAHQICLEVYRDKLQSVVTASRRYKDELLEACLEMLLSAPTSVMTISVSQNHRWYGRELSFTLHAALVLR